MNHNPVEFLSVLSRPSLIQACCWISLNVGRFLSSGFNNHRINSRIWRATGIAGLKRNSQRVISRSFGNGTWNLNFHIGMAERLNEVQLDVRLQ